MSNLPNAKDEVMKAFLSLQEERQKLKAKIITKEESAQKAKDNETAETASSYTVGSIIKDLADVQLSFGEATENLSEQLRKETEKLSQLKTAIKVKTAHIKEVNDAKIAADALHIIKQERDFWNTDFEKESSESFKALEEEVTKSRESWQKGQEEFEQNVKERKALLQKSREKELADYQYDLDKKFKIEADEYEEDKKQLERELAESQASKEKDWKKREKVLDKNQEKFVEYQTKVDGFEEELKEATEKARKEAIGKAQKEAKIKADLMEKEMESNKQAFEMQITSLESNIDKNYGRIEQLTQELKEALVQVQDLSNKVLENTKKQNSSKAKS